ncbi:MAG: hypothetical protein NZ741_03960, partial [Armatimonadetes bacterium]|nr:hypothetical protein [Armatimonadota bacterium]
QERYGEALQELRAASIQLTAWAAQAPPWELRFVWALTSPNRVNTRERRWRERREKVASELRYVIASEISLLQALQRIQERRTPSYAP